jgi:hypothetical protein
MTVLSLYVGAAVLEFLQTANGGGCFLGLQCFPPSVLVWDMRFSPHSLHGSMLEVAGCECESMYRSFFPNKTAAIRALEPSPLKFLA